MFSKILVKLIDQAIVPAVLLVAARIVSVVLIASYNKIDFSMDTGGLNVANPSQFLLVNSYSVLIMSLLLFLGITYVLLKSYVFHDSHITPKLTANMFSLKLSSFIQTSFDLYSQGSIWLSYMYLLMFVSGLMAFFGVLYPWVFTLLLGLCIISTILLVFDVEREVDMDKKVFPEFVSEEDN